MESPAKCNKVTFDFASRLISTFDNGMSQETIVLSTEQIRRILKRISYQVIEAFGDDKSIIVVGIPPRGIWVAEEVVKHIQSISNIRCELVAYSEQNDKSLIEVTGKDVLLIDDIVNSGGTMMKTAGEISLAGARTLKTACLVDRLHRKFPIHSDFTGLSLATTIQEHLTLSVSPEPTITLQ